MRTIRSEDGAALALAATPPRRGGESVVYDATGPGGPCVVKVALAPSPDGDWLHVERRLLEGLGADPATVALVPRVLHHGSWDGRPWLALERLAGTAGERLPERTADRLRLAARITHAVARLHAARPDLIHRDLKPSNVLVDGDRVLLTDFGAARELRPGRSTTTRALATPGYAAPEQLLPHRAPDRSWDVFGLAATVYHVVVGVPADGPGAHGLRWTERGRRLWTGQDDGRGEPWVYLALDGPPLTRADVERLDAAVTGPLRAALERALAPDPRRRSGTADDLLAAVRASRARAVPPRVWVALGLAAASLAGVGLAARSPPPPDYPLVPIPAGTVDGPHGPVEVPAFRIGAVEVDQALFRAVTGIDLGRRRQVLDDGAGRTCDRLGRVSLLGDHLPAVCVDGFDAVRFANALSARHGLPPAYTVVEDPVRGRREVVRDPASPGFHLPTVAQWRRALDRPVGPHPADPCAENIGDAAYAREWVGARVEACDDGWVGPSPVGAMPPNALGVHDLHGNVQEWLDDVEPDGRRWGAGGHWSETRVTDFPYGAAAAGDPTLRGVAFGFRLARSVP